MSTKVNVPALPESVADATVLSWYKQAGEPVNRDETIVDLETDKVVLEVPSTVDGVLGQITAAAGATVQAGDLLCLIEPGKAAAPSPAPKASTETPKAAVKPVAVTAEPVASEPRPEAEEPVLTPAVRRLVKAMEIDPRTIRGTGKDGRILKSDVTAHLAHDPAARTHCGASAGSAAQCGHIDHFQRSESAGGE